MAKLEAPEEVTSRPQETGRAEVLVGIPGPVDVGQLQALAANMAPLGSASGPGDVAVAYPSASGIVSGAEISAGACRMLPYELQASSGPIPWLPHAAAYEALFQLTRQIGARVCVVLNPDLKAFDHQTIESLLTPVAGNACDLAMPVYPVDRLEGLLNFGVLEPMVRALYGRRVRFPLASDFAVSTAFAGLLLERGGRNNAVGSSLLWPATEAAVRERRIWEVHLPMHHELSAEGVDLSTILLHVLDPLFSEVERYAAVWQRIRGSQPMTVSGDAEGAGLRAAGDDSSDGTEPLSRSVDPRPMAEAFQLGYRNLQEIWGLVLPPVLLLQLKSISRLPIETFRLPDELWAKVVYDFALAHRLRPLPRNQLLGAFTPLYLGWVASYVREVAAMTEEEADARRGRLQRAFEETKPYLLQRWRWPDRFNP